MTFKALQMAQVRRAEAERGRAAWRSVAGAAMRTLAAAAVSAALSLGAWQAWRWATGSEAFTIREIRFSGLVHAQEADLLQRRGLKPGANLFRTDLGRAARALQTHPWVASAALARRLPGEVLATIVEHRPAALVQLGGLYARRGRRLFKRGCSGGPSRSPGRDRPPARRGRSGSRSCSCGCSARSTCSTPGARRVSRWPRYPRCASTRTADTRPSPTTDRGAGSAARLERHPLAAAPAQIRAALARRGERAAKIDLDNPARPDQAAATLADKR
jgi:cell division protein FtsQ